MTLNELYDMAAEDEIEVYPYKLPGRKALSIWNQAENYTAIAINPENLESIAEERVLLAHEMGHCETLAFYNQYAAIENIQKLERQADKWAIQHLVTVKELKDLYQAGYTEYWQLAEQLELPENFVRKAVAFYAEQSQYSNAGHVLP